MADQEFDFFEITGLVFDPPEKAPKKVKGAIEKAEKEFNASLGTVSQTAERNEINEKLAFLARIKSQVFDANGKLTDKFGELAAEKVAAAMKKLESAVRFAKLSKSALVVTSGTIKEQRKKTKLSKESVEEVYKRNGFTITEINPLAAMPKFPSNAEKICDDLAELRKTKDPDPKGIDTSKVNNLYDFAAYLENRIGFAVEYRKRSNAEMTKLFDSFAKNNATRQDPLGKLCCAIATAGKTYVFDSDEHREAYENYLKFRSPELSELFEIIRDTPELDRRDPSFVKVCVEKITDVFDNSATALAVYNYAAGFMNDPVDGGNSGYIVKCGKCGTQNRFDTLESAQKTNRCSTCGQQLYKKCLRNGCGKLVLESAEKCPFCQYVFANADLFDDYIASAEGALTQGDIDTARAYLKKARQADPRKKSSADALEEKIEHGPIAGKINELRKLLEERKFLAASNYLPQLVSQFPNLDIENRRKEINSVLSQCKKLIETVDKSNRAKTVNACLDALDICSDYQPAIELLKSSPPIPVSDISASLNDVDGTVHLSWRANGERNVAYSVVRKEGSTAPLTEQDGVCLLKRSGDLFFTDTNAQAGKRYVYSVFSVRTGTASTPSSVCVKTLLKVSNITYEQRGQTIHISWGEPQNCTSVRVTKTVNGKVTALTNTAGGYCDDSSIIFNVAHNYTFYACYQGVGESAGVMKAIVPTPVISSFDIYAKAVKTGEYEVSWGISRKDVDIQILVNQKPVEKLSSGVEKCRIMLPANGFYVLQARAFSGGSWLASRNSIEINTYMPCTLDMEASSVSEMQTNYSGGVTSKIEFHLKLGGTIPTGISEFCCFIRSKESPDQPAPWANANEIDHSGDMIRMDYKSYCEAKEIFTYRLARNEETYYVTLFTVYRINGKTVCSPPFRKKINRPLNVDVYWRVNKSFFGKKQLIVDIVPNRPFMRRPQLTLCASKSGRFITSAEDSDAVTVITVPERVFTSSQTGFQESFDIDASLERGTMLFLFQSGELASERFNLRWADGFNGKI